ncbi:MAG: FAD-binding and (Fe-S)-binding domain-containing protein [Cyclobacteriaceae bacterium]
METTTQLKRTFEKLTLEGELHTDSLLRKIYATDASVYKQLPAAVAYPKNVQDIQKLIAFASTNELSLIPRTAGTSLAGQVVGDGIIVDVSKHFTKIIELNVAEKWVIVEPAVVRDELNKYLEEHGLFFAPETSTSNRCMIGGMVGNNSCGSHSVVYGTTRDHLLELDTLLHDGSEATFKSITKEEFEEKKALQNVEGDIYREISHILDNKENQEEIRKEFPKPEIKRRNTGYAIDVLLETAPFTEREEAFNFCKLLAGSEGTLAFTTQIKLNLVDLPPKEKAVVAVHCKTLEDSFQANLIALKYKPEAVELIDKVIIDCTRENAEQKENSWFIEGTPEALLVVEFAKETKAEVEQIIAEMQQDIESQKKGYHFPIIWGKDVPKVWAMRAAGLGLLANIPGDPKAVACIEDTAVTVEDLPAYMKEFKAIMEKYGKESVYYAHIGDGEIHLRPVLDLKKSVDRELFLKITDDVATLVKKYGGSMSGEHGDGRVRAPFIKKMIGDHNYNLIKKVKKIWDPKGIFNPGKITDAPPMNEFLRYEADVEHKEPDTTYDFSETAGVLRMAEKCNGTGACRKSHIIGGTMCPSYMATKNEKDTTRARANVLRDVLTNSNKVNKFDSPEIKEVMDLCLSCKGCQSECPSNVDVAMMKSEFLHQYYKDNKVPLRSKMIANVAKTNSFFSNISTIYNFVNSAPLVSTLIKSLSGIAVKRPLPKLHSFTLKSWYSKYYKEHKPKVAIKSVWFFADEIINYNDVEIGIKAIKLLTQLNYNVMLADLRESGRPAMSKGLLDHAKDVANFNVKRMSPEVSDNCPMVGLEPSAVLSFRDEYPKLVADTLKQQAKLLAPNCLLIDEFIAKEIALGNITKEHFTNEKKLVKLHGHCHQKAVASVKPTEQILSFPTNYEVETIPSGCCGMSGSFGYEKEHYDLSMQIGELVLFPAVRKAEETTLIAAPGTSCRHQIWDGTKRKALHPVEILFDALRLRRE